MAIEHSQWCENLGIVDPDIDKTIRAETKRQHDKLILIPSESLTPLAVREALGSVFTSIYAEGYPPKRNATIANERLSDLDEEMAYYRRYGDRRFYKGTEFADVVESLAQRRVAGLFANERARAEQIFANVQPLSGAAANNAVYEALLTPGDTVMGMALNEGGHLTHGSPVNRSGKYFKIVSYGLNPATGRLDYDAIEQLAQEHQPRMIIAGATAYPWEIDWQRLRQIADGVHSRAYLLADISHPAGLVVAGLFPNPVGYADVTTFTTHKTLLGPRAAVILTTSRGLADKIDRAVFPGEQGGPHLNQIAAMAVAFKLAEGENFARTMQGIIANAKALAQGLLDRGLTLVGGGTNSHLLLIDLNRISTGSSLPLKGEVAARILDIAGIICNRNTIPGDLIAAQASGIRLGTVWATQRGFGPDDMDLIAGLVHEVLTNIRPFVFPGRPDLGRGKIDFETLQKAREGLRNIQPHANTTICDLDSDHQPDKNDSPYLELRGERVRDFLEETCVSNLRDLAPGQSKETGLLTKSGSVLAEIVVLRLENNAFGQHRFMLITPAERTEEIWQWLSDLSDGYVLFDEQRLEAKIDGPVVVRRLSQEEAAAHNAPLSQVGQAAIDTLVEINKPYFIGQEHWTQKGVTKPACELTTYTGQVRQSVLHDEHLKLTAAKNLIPFANWQMPVSYGSIAEEHQAVRQTAALFDVTHMGVLEVTGSGATRFLELVTSNCVNELSAGKAQYSFLLNPDGTVLDDIFVYCRASDRYMMVVNAANAERDESWLRAVNERRCAIDHKRAWIETDTTVTIRNLREPACVADCRVDIALQGPRSLGILQSLMSPEAATALALLGKSEFFESAIGGIEAIVSRTGYTGEQWGFELYVHPNNVAQLWRLLIEHGSERGLKPAGLAARDSARIEAGFPLWGHELAGQHNISPMGAGYGSYVKAHKPFFIGRDALLAADVKRTMQIVRFATDSRGTRAIRAGDPVAEQRGRVVGYVTSATVIGNHQIGLAYVDRRYGKVGTQLNVLPLSRRSEVEAPPKLLAELKPGDEVTLPESAKVVPQFGLRLGEEQPQSTILPPT
jgi:glycine hydroxymethyltransferase